MIEYEANKKNDLLLRSHEILIALINMPHGDSHLGEKVKLAVTLAKALEKEVEGRINE